MMNDSGSCIFCSSDAASLRWWRQTAVLSLLCHSLVIVDHRLLSHRWTLIKFNSRILIRVHLFCQCCVILSWLSCCKFFPMVLSTCCTRCFWWLSFWQRILSPDNHNWWHCLAHFWQNGLVDSQWAPFKPHSWNIRGKSSDLTIFHVQPMVNCVHKNENLFSGMKACFWRRRRRLVIKMIAAAARRRRNSGNCESCCSCCRRCCCCCCCRTAAPGSREAVQSQKWAVF